MSLRSFFYNLIFSALTTVAFFVLLTLSEAEVMQSGSYQIQSDSINFGGGYSTSSNYIQESTFGEVATGIGTSTSYNLYAGYQQMQTVFISLTGASNVNLSPEIGGVTGGESDGATTVTVITDSPAGYSLTLQSELDPAMQSGANTIANYNPGTDPDFSFVYAANEAVFGYTPEGVDITQRWQDSGGICNTSGGDTSLACWDGASTTAVTIAAAANPNHPDGATTTVRFRVGVGSGVNQAPGVYVATTTLTAIAL